MTVCFIVPLDSLRNQTKLKADALVL